MKQIQKSYEKLQQKCVRHIMSLVRRRFKTNKNLTFFIMERGVYYFVDIHGEKVWDFNYKELHDFIAEWDDRLYFSQDYLELTSDDSKI